MSFETVERLKRDFTDKWVTVDPGTPELKRFVGLSGLIKTVNMNGRALVQFDNPVDISWYDIDLAYLNVIAAPLPKKVAEKHAAEPAEKKPAAAAKPTAPAAGKSPIEQARAQGAAGSAAVKKSPLELAREQGAAKAAATAPPAAATGPAATGDKPLSKLEQARASAAQAKAAIAGAVVVAAPAAEPVAEAPAPVPAATPAPAVAAPVSLVGADGKPLSKIEQARRQGAFKG